MIEHVPDLWGGYPREREFRDLVLGKEINCVSFDTATCRAASQSRSQADGQFLHEHCSSYRPAFDDKISRGLLPRRYHLQAAGTCEFAKFPDATVLTP